MPFSSRPLPFTPRFLAFSGVMAAGCGLGVWGITTSASGAVGAVCLGILLQVVGASGMGAAAETA